MRRWITAVLSMVLVTSWGVGAANAQAPSLVGGGLTALPAVKLGPDQLKNGGFETLSGGLPANWTAGSGWSVDQLTKRSGNYSFRRTGSAPTSQQSLALKKGIYKFSAWIKTENLGGGSVGMRLQADFRPGFNEWTNSDIITGTRDWTLYELKNIVVPSDRTVTFKLENYGGPSGTAWFDDVKVEEQEPQALDVYLLHPNFRGMLFDDQPSTMRFDITVTPPVSDFGRYRVAGTLRDEATGAVVATSTHAAAAHLGAGLEGGAMQPGRAYLAAFSLVDQSNGSTVYTYPAYRVSKAPASARQSMNISFDARNRVLVRGVPRFVLGVYDAGSGYSSSDSFWENQLWSPTGERRMDGMKINFYLNYWYGESPLGAMNALMDNLQKRGVMYLQTGNCFDKHPAGTQFHINGSDAYVRDFGAHPGSAGYYTVDECISSLIPGAFSQHDRLRRLDPDSMTFAALFGNPDIALWRDAADILSADPYPMFGAEPSGGYNHKQVADWTIRTREAVKDARPFMTVLQFFKFTSQGRWPTRQEMRNHAYMAIVEGARGLWWWSLGSNALKDVCSGWCAEKTAHMNNLKAVVNEIADLEPALLADDAPTALTGNSNPSAIRTKVKVVGGKGYVFAYNYTNSSTSATFTWNTAPGTVTVNAEGRNASVSGTSFTDSFGPYQAHVYVVANGGSGGGAGGGGTAPSSPAVSFVNPAAGATVSGTTTVTLSATGGSGGYTYRLAVDGTNVFTGTNPSFSWNTANVANGSRTLTATVTDSAGQSGTATRTVTVSNSTTPPPTTPPPSTDLTVGFTSPAAGATVSGTTTVAMTASGGSGYTYRLAVDGTQVYTGTGASYAWNTTGVANGSRTLTATVTDSTGKTGTATRTVTVSNATATPPPPPATGTLRVAITAPRSGDTVSGTAWAVLWVEGQSGSANTFTLSAAGQTLATATASSRGPVSLPYDTRRVADGAQALTATVRDATGNTGSTSITVVFSNGTTTPPPTTPPPSTDLTVGFTSPAAGATVSGTTTVAMTASGGSGYTYRLAVDGTQVYTGTGASHAWNTTGVANGSRTLTATVTDSTGKTGTATRTVTVSNTTATPPPPPATGTLKVFITAPTSGATVSGTAWTVLWVEGASGSANTFTLSAGSQVIRTQTTASSGPVSVPWTTTSLANGTHTLTATVTDATGRTGTTSVTVTVRN